MPIIMVKRVLKMELNTEELFYVIGLVNQHLEDNKFTFTSSEITFRFDLKQKLSTEVKRISRTEVK